MIYTGSVGAPYSRCSPPFYNTVRSWYERCALSGLGGEAA